MKKIMILMTGILFSANITFAMEIGATGMANIDSNGNVNLMENFDSLVDDVKKDCICTMEYAPICGQQDEDLMTFGNQCEFNCANKKNKNIKFLYKGECKDKKVHALPPKKIDPTNLKVPFDDDNWVMVDNDFYFNSKTKEWKDSFGICHTCTPENGFTKDGRILIDGEKSIEQIKSEMQKRKKDIGISEIAESKVEDNNAKKEISIKFDNKNVKLDAGIRLDMEDGVVVLDEKKVVVTAEMAEDKAKRVSASNSVLNTEIKSEEGNVYYFIKTEKDTKFLGLFDFSMETNVKVDIETGEVVDIDEPWYSFLLF